jgi:hypothetical protein
MSLSILLSARLMDGQKVSEMGGWTALQPSTIR